MSHLIVETVAAQPHLETAGEIALELIEQGEDVCFLWLGDSFDWPEWELNKKYKILGLSYKNRVKAFLKIIANKGVKVLPPLMLSAKTVTACDIWADKFSGSIEDLKAYKYRNASLGMGVASSLISMTGDPFLNTSNKENLQRVRQGLKVAAKLFETTELSLRSLRPQYVYTFNGRFATSRPIVEASKSLSVKVLRHERGATFDKYELFEKPIHDFDYRQKLIDAFWKNSNCVDKSAVASEFFIRKRAGDGIGWRSFVNAQTRGKDSYKRISGKTRVVYFSSSDDEFSAISDVTKNLIFRDQIDAITNLVKICENIGELELVIRVHPNIATKSAVVKDFWCAISGKNVTLIPPTDKTDSYALLDSADVVVTYGSCIGIEAVFWKKPSILIGPCAYSGSGATIEPRNRKELRKLMSHCKDLKPSERRKSLPYGYYFLQFGSKYKWYQPCGLFDGTFCNKNLSWKPAVIRYFQKLLREQHKIWER